MKNLTICIIFSALSLVVACGRDQDASAPTPRLSSPPLSLVPSDMPDSKLDDPRLIDFWSSDCIRSGNGSLQWTLLLDPGKAVLGQQLFTDGNCSQLGMNVKFYLRYRVANEFFESSLWQVHALVANKIVAESASQVGSCGFSKWQSDTWYNLTNASCELRSDRAGVWLSPTARDSMILRSRYSVDSSGKILLFSSFGTGQLRMTRGE